jgi:hypothetical protein
MRSPGSRAPRHQLESRPSRRLQLWKKARARAEELHRTGDTKAAVDVLLRAAAEAMRPPGGGEGRGRD